MEEYLSNILSQIITPADLRQMPESKLPEVCKALRAFIIDQVSVHPGHFASSLGAIELTVALHYVYDTPEDRIVWDVGHQAYAHKILTGRRERFHTLRQRNGLSGFPTPAESPYDTFSAGHASNSISAALGMAVAAKLEHSERKVIAVIGDAAISGGLAFEGLNNASSVPNDLLIVLNDNQMAIDPNTGALYHYLVRITTSSRYNQLRYKAYTTLKRYSLMRDGMRRALIRFSNSVKSLFAHRQNIFEGLDIRYFGPVDGHDVVSLVHILRQLKRMRGPKMLHLCTIKGKGYAPAEQEATIWHAPGKFNKETGERIKEESDEMPPKYQDVFGLTLVELAEADQRIVGITPAMPTGCSMTYMMKAFPERSFDVGIAEEHAVTFSGGLAKEGLVPVCNIYSSFMQRAMDEVIHDVALMHLHVVFCLDRAGLVGADGVTHHGLYDVAFFRTIPGMIVASPMDEHWLRYLLYTAVHNVQGPIAIRYPRGRSEHRNWQCVMKAIEIGKGRCIDDGLNGGELSEAEVQTAVLSFGPVGNEVTRAIALAKQHQTRREGYAHYDMVFAKPLDTELLDQAMSCYSRIITVEDGVRDGGFGSAVTEYLTAHEYKGEIVRVGVPDRFIMHGTVKELYQECGMDAESIANLLTT
jgi:1-deoxy-D-xylulose-5-phosphate synthase